MNDPAPLRSIESALEVVRESYAGKTRYTQLEYEALLKGAGGSLRGEIETFLGKVVA